MHAPTLMSFAIGVLLTTGSSSSYAASAHPGDSLTIAPGVATYSNNAVISVTGSWWAFGSATLYGSIEPNEMNTLTQGPDGGIQIGRQQDTNGHLTHFGPPHSGVGGIDGESTFLGNTAMHFTTVPVIGLNAQGSISELDFSGWNLAWALSNQIPLGTGAWQPANCSALGCGGHTFSNGRARFLWDGTYGSSYTLDYTATVPLGDPSALGGFQYYVHLEGTVVPLPASIWLAGSGLCALLGFAKRGREGAKI